jgi:cytosine/adenosine deaminase-related metal-dependent hydrolase
MTLALLGGCREALTVPDRDDAGGVGSQAGWAGDPARGPAEQPNDNAAGAGGDAVAGTTSAGGAAGVDRKATQPPLVTCTRKAAPQVCSASGDSRLGVRLIGTLLEPLVVRERGVLDLDANGTISCAACDCGDDDGKLVIDCPDLVISPGFVNLHDHLGYAGTPPLAHPGELYQHRNDWRLGEHGHAALPFAGGATAAQVLAQELRMLLSGTTSIVGAGGRRGWLRNLEVSAQTQGLMPGHIVAQTFPLDDAHGAVDSAACDFGAKPDTAAVAQSAQAYVAHVGEGTDARAQDELRCALSSLDLLGQNSAVVHAMALSRSDASKLARRGTSVVWSPRSNLDLYGSTAPVALLTSLGVRIALGTDWLASGSMNLQRELACAREYDAAVLGGYFNAFQRWRMVTEHPAWALGLEQRFATLRVGLAGDIAVFAAHGNDAYASAVDAAPADVKLVLRQGTPLYGDGELVKAFRDGEACEELDVCGATQRACSLETGQSLADIRAAGEAVYPLFSCETPPDEPHCEATLTRECPAGEADCQPPPPPPAWDTTDADRDGVSDVLDDCPRIADPEQADTDGDQRGDACDPCPSANPGLMPCPLSIAELRDPASRGSSKAAVLLSGARVTALRTQDSKGFYVEDGDHGAYSGIFVYTGSSTPGVKLGDQVRVQGYFDTFQGTDELIDVQVLSQAPADAYPPLRVSLADLADSSAQAPGLASLLVRIEGAVVDTTNPDAPKDFDETGLFGGLRLDDLLYPGLDNVYPSGSVFSSITGIAGFSFGHQKLYPRGPSDLAAP